MVGLPTKQEFLDRTGGIRAEPLVRDQLADIETPVSAYWKLAHDEQYSFLLESVTGGEQLARYSILGVRPKVVLRAKNAKVTRIDHGNVSYSELAPGQDPLHLLQQELGDTIPTSTAGLPPFIGGAITMFSYDFVRYLEEIGQHAKDDLGMDDMAAMLTGPVVVFDHAKNLIRIIVMTDGSAESYDQARAEIERIQARLAAPLPQLPSKKGVSHPVEPNVDQETYEGMVRKMKEYIVAGDVFQSLPSQRFKTKVDAHPLTVYRALRSINPSPYMFLLRFGDFELVGASPELLTSLHGRTAKVRPIAGTRWRGKTPAEDDQLAADLLADQKERAEHIMLIDLGRNDLGRVCEIGSVKVGDLMIIERYSHVMHIVSDVTGELAADKNAADLLRATYPAGTVSGAPKVRAMQIIEELEPTRRGSYAGSVGTFSFTGDMDLCITLRTILLKDGHAYVQAGAGIVYDSDPTYEYNESCNKAKASLAAIEMAQQGL